MNRPAPYPTTDAAEQKAVSVFLNLIDPTKVKADIRTRDKVPNVDGTIEIVDSDQVPVGKVDVQIRKIRRGATTYSCSAKLVAYSSVSTLPLILVCVDADSERAFWRQITRTMPEFKEQQASFTIHFDPISDSIEATGLYLLKWTEIISDYRERIARYPLLSQDVANKLTLVHASRRDKLFFQKYIDAINRLLDIDFIVVKELLFPDVWKLGVGIIHSDESGVSYQLYRVRYGEPIPLVCVLRGAFPINDLPGSTPESRHYSTWDYLGDAEEAGARYVLERVKRVVEARSLPVHGRLMSADILLGFVDKYPQCLGLLPGQRSYSTKELSDALNSHLLGVCAAIARQMSLGGLARVDLDLDLVSRFLSRTRVAPIPPSESRTHFAVGSRVFPLKSVFDSLRYLQTNDISEVQRPFSRRDRPLVSGDYIWAGYTEDAEVHRAQVVLGASLDEYAAFLKGNRLTFAQNRYLDANISVLFEYVPSDRTPSGQGPILHEYHLDNSRRGLPRLLVRAGPGEASEHAWPPFPQISFDGEEYECTFFSGSTADFLFEAMPVRNLIYRMLRHDLEANYSMGGVYV